MAGLVCVLAVSSASEATVSRILLEVLQNHDRGIALLERLAALSADGRPLSGYVREASHMVQGRERYMNTVFNVINFSSEREVIRLRGQLEGLQGQIFSQRDLSRLESVFARTGPPRRVAGADRQAWTEAQMMRAFRRRERALGRFFERSRTVMESRANRNLWRALSRLRNPHRAGSATRMARGLTAEQRALADRGFDVLRQRERLATRDPAVLEEWITQQGVSLERDLRQLSPALYQRVRTGRISLGELEKKFLSENISRRYEVLVRILRERGIAYNQLPSDIRRAFGVMDDTARPAMVQDLDAPALITLLESRESMMAGALVRLPEGPMGMLGGAIRSRFLADRNVAVDAAIDVVAGQLAMTLSYAWADGGEDFWRNPQFHLDSIVVLLGNVAFVGLVGKKSAYARRMGIRNGGALSRYLARLPSNIFEGGSLRELGARRWAGQRTATFVVGAGSFAAVGAGLGVSAEFLLRQLENMGLNTGRTEVQRSRSYWDVASYYGLFAGLSTSIRYQGMSALMRGIRATGLMPSLAMSYGLRISPRVAVGFRDGLPYIIGLGARYRNSAEASDQLAGRRVEGDTTVERLGNWLTLDNLFHIRGAVLDYRNEIYEPSRGWFREMFEADRQPMPVHTAEEDQLARCREMNGGIATEPNAAIDRRCRTALRR